MKFAFSSIFLFNVAYLSSTIYTWLYQHNIWYINFASTLQIWHSSTIVFFFVNYMYIYNSADSIQVHLEPFLLLVFSLFLHIPFDFGCNNNNLIVNIMIPLIKTDPHNDQFVMEQNTDSNSIGWNEWTISSL